MCEVRASRAAVRLALAAVCASVQIAQYKATFITLRDANFYEEDAALNASLYQRMAANKPAYEPRPLAVREEARPALRNDVLKKLDPSDFRVREQMLYSMKQLIYSAQERMRDLEPLTRMYSDDIRYRVAFIFCRLKTLEGEMEEQYSALWAIIKKRQGIAMRFLIAVFYYEHDLRRFVDVVYIIEHFYKVHAEYLATTKDKKDSKEEEQHEREERTETEEKNINMTWLAGVAGLPEGMGSVPPEFLNFRKEM